jgi:predicted nucleic acid-binding protein
VPTVLIDDHLLRDVLTGARGSDLGGLATSLATTGLWLFRLNSSWADPLVEGKLSLPVRNLSAERQTRFLERLTALPEEIEVLPLRQLARSMATLQRRHRSQGRPLSTAMVEALAAAHFLKSAIAVSQNDVGPHLRAAAEFDGIGFHIL